MTATAHHEASYGSTATAHCRPCGGVRTWIFGGRENHVKPEVVYWRCTTDGHVRLQMADVTDSEALCRAILDRQLRATGTSVIDYEDALGLLNMELWDIYRAWDPTRGVRFTAYATGLLRLRVNNYWRQALGRDTPKAHAGALSLDAATGEDGGSLGDALAAREVDPLSGRRPDLAGLLSLGGGPGALRALALGGARGGTPVHGGVGKRPNAGTAKGDRATDG